METIHYIIIGGVAYYLYTRSKAKKSTQKPETLVALTPVTPVKTVAPSPAMGRLLNYDEESWKYGLLLDDAINQIIAGRAVDETYRKWLQQVGDALEKRGFYLEKTLSAAENQTLIAAFVKRFGDLEQRLRDAVKKQTGTPAPVQPEVVTLPYDAEMQQYGTALDEAIKQVIAGRAVDAAFLQWWKQTYDALIQRSKALKTLRSDYAAISKAFMQQFGDLGDRLEKAWKNRMAAAVQPYVFGNTDPAIAQWYSDMEGRIREAESAGDTALVTILVERLRQARLNPKLVYQYILEDQARSISSSQPTQPPMRIIPPAPPIPPQQVGPSMTAQALFAMQPLPVPGQHVGPMQPPVAMQQPGNVAGFSFTSIPSIQPATSSPMAPLQTSAPPQQMRNMSIPPQHEAISLPSSPMSSSPDEQVESSGPQVTFGKASAGWGQPAGGFGGQQSTNPFEH